MRMTIGILANYLFREKKTGIEVYATEIVSRLLRIKEVDWRILVGKSLLVRAKQEFPSIPSLSLSGYLPKDLLYDIPRYVAGGEFEYFFNPSQYTFRGRHQQSAVCGFDVAWNYYPEYFPLSKRLAFDGLTRYLCRVCPRVICISKSTIRDMVSLYGLDEDKAVLAYPAFDTMLFNPQPREADLGVLAKFGVKGEFVLHLGTLQRRKNVELLIDLFGRLKSNDLQLVLAGGPGWGYKEIVEKVRTSGRSNAIILTGFVSDQEKAALYRNASLYANLSLYEGFGIPILEAMACGAPTLVSKKSSFPEILDSERFSANLERPEEIVAKMEDLIIGGRPAASDILVKKAAQFSWEKTAKTVFATLCSLVAQNA